MELVELIERLYAHDELAAEGFQEQLQQIGEDIPWDESALVTNRKLYELETHVITILGAYEDVGTRS